MSNRKIVVNWLRDSIIGFGLILLAIAIANSLHALVWFHHPKLYWCWFAVGIVPFCLFARWRGVSSFDTWTQILRWIGVIPVAIVGHQFASLGMLHLWSFCSSLIASVLSSDAAAVLQKFVTAPLMWAIVAAVSTWAAVTLAPGYKRSVALLLTLRMIGIQGYGFLMLFSLGGPESPFTAGVRWAIFLVTLGHISGVGIVAWIAFYRPRFVGQWDRDSGITGVSGKAVKLWVKAFSSRFGKPARVCCVVAATCGLAAIVINSVWRTNRDEPTFVITLPDSQHQKRTLHHSWQHRISVVRPNASLSNGMAPPGTSSAWSRWLVIRVLESLDTSTPRYYFVDLDKKQTVGPWSPGENVYLEGFDPDGRFVAFARDSFMSHRSITQRIHHFDPATNTASKFDRPANESWQECFSLDRSTMAVASGGSGSALLIGIQRVRDGWTTRTLKFPERRTMLSGFADRDRLGRRWALSPDGKFLAMSGNWVESAELNVIEIWNTTSGKLDHRFDESVAIGERDASVSAVRFSPDTKELIVELLIERRNREFRRFDLKTKKPLEGFNPWEGLTSNKIGNYGYSAGVVGMDGKHILWWRRPKLQDNQHTAAWEISVTNINGNPLRDWKQLPNRIARQLDDRLDARIVPGSDRIAIMNPYRDSISWYDWQTDELRRFATTHKHHNQVDHYATQPGWISVLYREQNRDITIKVWSVPTDDDS
jgi:hypothetical protein